MATRYSKFDTARITRVIAEQVALGQPYPVGRAAEMLSEEHSAEDVYLIARAAGYSVFKRNGRWYEQA